MTFAQRRNRLTTHFSERIAVVKRRVSVLMAQCHVCTAVLTLDAGLLARSQYPEGPATGHLDTGFSWFPCLQANAQTVPQFPSCYYMPLM